MSRKQKIHEPLGVSFKDALTSIADENKPAEVSFTARPFVKWVGGKRSILPTLTQRMPEQYKTYYEPFLGGGALFFSVKPKDAYLSDINFHLVVTFNAVKDDVEAVIKHLKSHQEKHNKTYFLNARDLLFTEANSAKLAALFTYLNKTCFNGLYRVNQSGKFNVPIGSYKHPAILDEENLRATADVLKTATISQHGFSHIKLEKNSFYYLDPPYHETYAQYDGSGFGDKEHTSLAGLCSKIDSVGGLFLVSNSDTPFIRSLYKNFIIEQVSASRSVSCKGEQRGKEKELLIRNY